MKCPKCNEGTIIKIRFKKTEQVGFLCDVCEALWFENEDINFNTGHTLASYSQTEDAEYIIDELSEKDQNHQPAQHTKSK